MILTPRYLAGVADGVVDIFSQAENEILADIARRIVKTGSVTNTAGWELQKMREAGMLNEDTVKQLAAATNQSEAEIQRMLKDSYKRALSFDIDVIPADLKMSWTQIKDNPAFRAIMLQGVNNANQLVSNFTKTTAGAAQTAFFNALDVSYLQHITGAQTREEAVRGALKKLAQQGIYKVAYPQDNGGVYYNSVEAAVRRALTTAVNQSCAKLQLANCDMLGTDLVETTAHLGARPSHAVWQGKVFSRSGSTKKYPDFVKSTGYGTGDGLCGWNCRHSFFPYFEGYSTPAYDMGKFDSEENARLYEEEQKQRRYERMVREAKREVSTLEAGFEAAESPELQEGIAADLQQAKTKLRNRQKRLRDYCNEHGLYNDYSRTYTAGYNDKSRVKIGNKNTSKKLDKSAKSGIIKSGSDEGMYRKSKKGKIEPMPKKQFHRLEKSFKRRGGMIQYNAATDEYLKTKEAEGITYNSTTILLKQNPGRASVFEELIHAHQYRTGKNDGSYLSRLNNEIDAQNKLIRHRKLFQLTQPEIEQTKSALIKYKKELEEYHKKGGK